MVLGRRSTTPFEKRIGYRFHRAELLELALTHRSFASEQGWGTHYERLEFLGDSVLGLVAAEWLYARYPQLPEGELSKLKAHLVSKTVLAAWAERVELGAALRLGVGEERSGGRTKSSLLADSLEAVFGAVYLDGGIADAREVVVPMLEASAEGRTQIPDTDAKTPLQEAAQARGWALPEYRLIDSSGPDHNKVWSVECWVNGACAGRGLGPSKKAAEQQAAADALSQLAKSATIPPP
ncbi:MAG TPA: ribonuclease III [Thermoanaerobaculia bacterium]|nr:ribonuclease III [Thermoanaerobaculia bacterium]